MYQFSRCHAHNRTLVPALDECKILKYLRSLQHLEIRLSYSGAHLNNKSFESFQSTFAEIRTRMPGLYARSPTSLTVSMSIRVAEVTGAGLHPGTKTRETKILHQPQVLARSLRILWSRSVVQTFNADGFGITQPSDCGKSGSQALSRD